MTVFLVERVPFVHFSQCGHVDIDRLAIEIRGRFPILTERESEISALTCTGIGFGYIAAGLGVKRTTIETHVRHVYRKLGVRNRSELSMLILLTDRSADDSER
jgi:DNA-binding CsgD family transcriptional regulator